MVISYNYIYTDYNLKLLRWENGRGEEVCKRAKGAYTIIGSQKRKNTDTSKEILVSSHQFLLVRSDKPCLDLANNIFSVCASNGGTDMLLPSLSSMLIPPALSWTYFFSFNRPRWKAHFRTSDGAVLSNSTCFWWCYRQQVPYKFLCLTVWQI